MSSPKSSICVQPIAVAAKTSYCGMRQGATMRDSNTREATMKGQSDSPATFPFCEIFEQHTNAFYLLALLLTGDVDAAEQCFLAGLDSCLNGWAVSKERAYYWSKRAIIKSAVRLVTPVPEEQAESSYTREDADTSVIPADLDPVLSLQDFNRFVFVMCVLERYSNRECAVLLNSSVQKVVTARSRAVLEIAKNNKSTPAFNALRYKPQPILVDPVCA